MDATAEFTPSSDCALDQVFDIVVAMRAPRQTTEVTRRLALSATEVAAMTALATALANDLPETENALQSGEIDIGVAAEIAALAGYLTPHQARLATDVMNPGTPEWRWLAPTSDPTPTIPATSAFPPAPPLPATPAASA
ncbi:hypothetical protein [Amycolatopsis saalfeldensis]|nr:hypothetical protein [Amycolatopsis saalfeldensis]